MGIKIYPSYLLQVIARSPEITKVTVYGRFKRSATVDVMDSAALFIRTNSKNYNTFGLFDPAINNPWSFDQWTVTTSYADYSISFTLNPDTGKKWTWYEIDNLQIGIAVRSPWQSGVGLYTFCTQCYIVVDYVGGSKTLRPNAVGAYCTITWETGDACPNHWKNVDEVTPDEDTTRVYGASTPGYVYDSYLVEPSGYD